MSNQYPITNIRLSYREPVLHITNRCGLTETVSRELITASLYSRWEVVQALDLQKHIYGQYTNVGYNISHLELEFLMFSVENLLDWDLDYNSVYLLTTNGGGVSIGNELGYLINYLHLIVPSVYTYKDQIDDLPVKNFSVLWERYDDVSVNFLP